MVYNHITLRTKDGELLSEATFCGVGKNEKGWHGRIEDVKTPVKHQGNRYAQEVIDYGITLAKLFDLYKLTLRCKPGLVKIYERKGFVLESNPEGSLEVCMRLNLK